MKTVNYQAILQGIWNFSHQFVIFSLSSATFNPSLTLLYLIEQLFLLAVQYFMYYSLNIALPRLLLQNNARKLIITVLYIIRKTNLHFSLPSL
jgi:hypothetical protein